MSSSRLGDLEICEFSDSEMDINPPVGQRQASSSNMAVNKRRKFPMRGITLAESCDLKMLIFGNTSATFDSDWQGQSFMFNHAIPYGLQQHKGGPCGLLSAVQAHILRQFLFELPPEDETSPENACKSGESQFPTVNNQPCQLGPKNPSKLMTISESRRKLALIKALSHILWQAGEKREAVVAAPSGRQVTETSIQIRKDGVIETLILTRFSKLEDLETFFTDQVKQLESEGSCVCFLYSAILSRGIDRVKADMDDPSNCLVGRHGYCTQEMVNLLLTGHAVSNVFDHEIVLCNSSDGSPDSKEGRLVLRGLNESSDIGFLSLFEHYDSCQVGQYYKCPHFPIWVVLSESHFTVLFALHAVISEASVDKDPENERWSPFDLYYYDTLGRQDAEIVLTINPPSAELKKPQTGEDLTPPLEHCIRTKWKKATIVWQGSEPLL